MTRRAQLDWLLEEFVEGTPGVVHGLVVSADGLRMAVSAQVGTTLGDQLAAAACGLVSLARGTAHLLAAGPVSQTILEMAGGYLFVTSIGSRGSGQGAALAVFADRSCDMGMVGYEMTLLATRAGHALTPALRPAAGGG